jgi:hypothetical protein
MLAPDAFRRRSAAPSSEHQSVVSCFPWSCPQHFIPERQGLPFAGVRPKKRPKTRFCETKKRRKKWEESPRRAACFRR